MPLHGRARTLSVLVPFLVFWRVGTASTQELSPRSTLDEVLAHAQQYNPGLQAARQSHEAARARIGGAGSWPDPTVSYGYFVDRVETRVGPQRHRIGLRQTIPLFGKMGLRTAVARAEAKAWEARQEQARLAVVHEVRRLWSELYFLGRSLQIARADLDLATYLEGVARRLYAAGSGSFGDVLKSQVELARAEDRLRTLEDQRSPLTAQLNAQLARPPLAPLDLPAALPQPFIFPIVEVLETMLAQHNPELRALREESLREQQAESLAQRRVLPDLTLGADYIEVGAADTDVVGSGKDAWMASASIQLPLWRGKHRAAAAAAQARRAAVTHQHAQRERELRARLHQIVASFDDSQRKIRLYDDTLLPRARQALEVTQGAFTAGRATFLDLVDAQQTLLELERAIERARADRAIHHSNLEMLVGTFLHNTPDEKDTP